MIIYIVLVPELYYKLANFITKIKALLVLKNQYYKIVRINKYKIKVHKIDKYKMNKYKYLFN